MNSSNNRPNNQEGGSDKKPLMKYEFRTSGDIQEAFLNVTHAPSIGRSVAQAEGKLMSPHEVEIAAIKEDRLTQERATARREDIALIQTNTPAVKKLADFSTTFSGYKSVTTTMGGKPAVTSWKNLVANPKAIETVRGSMQAEQEAMQQAKSGIVVADMYKPRGGAEMSLDRRTEGVLRREDNRFLLRNEQNEQMDASQERKKALTETDELIRRLEERNKARNKVGTVVRQSTEVAPLTRVTAPTLPVRGAQEDVAIDPVSLDGKASFDSARFLYQEEIEKAGKNMERVHALLEKRKKKGIASLLEKGYKGLPKALEIFKGVKPRYKIAMGVALAGASVATGGFTSALSIGLSTLSYSSGFYKKMIDAEMKKNPNVNKSHVAARAIGYGLVTALASSALIAGLFEGVDVPGAIDGAVAKVESAKDSISNWFSSFTSSPDLVYTGPVGDGINGLDLPYEPINGLDLPPEPNSAHLDGVVTGDGVPNNLSQGSHSSPWTTVQATPSSSVEMVSSPGSTGGLDSVTTETYEPHMTAQSSGAPFDAHESYMTSQSSAPFAENESYMTSPSQPVDNLDGAVTGQGTPNNLSNDGTLLDSSGNPIRSGSGGVVQSGGFADNRP